MTCDQSERQAVGHPLSPPHSLSVVCAIPTWHHPLFLPVHMTIVLAFAVAVWKHGDSYVAVIDSLMLLLFGNTDTAM